MADGTKDSVKTTGHFDAAKTIVEALERLDDKSAQELALRFAAETLKLQAPVSQTQQPKIPSNAPSSPQHGVEHSTDIKQFAESKAPKTDQEFATVVAYFYQFEAKEAERKYAINSKLLNDAARLVGRRRPTNAAYTLKNAKNSGYLDSVGSGDYKINSVGENLVAMALPDNGSESTERKRPRTRKSKSSRNPKPKAKPATAKKANSKK